MIRQATINALQCISSFVFFFFITFTLSAQSPKWALNGKTIDFTVDPPLLQDGNPGVAPSNGNSTYNAFYNSDGNPFFEIIGNAIYNQDNELVEFLPDLIEGEVIGPQLLINPDLQACGKSELYYVDYELIPVGSSSFTVTAHLRYSEYDISLNEFNGGVTEGKKDVMVASIPLGGDRQSHILMNGNSIYFASDGAGDYKILKVDVSEPTAPLVEELIVLDAAQFGGLEVAGEMEMSPNGDRLALSAFDANIGIVIIHLDEATGLVDTQQGNNGVTTYAVPGEGDLTGLEFSEDGNTLYHGRRKPFSSSVFYGIKKLNLSTGTVDIVNFDLSNISIEGDIQLAGDGYLYFPVSDNDLGRYNPATNEYSTSVFYGELAGAFYESHIGLFNLPRSVEGAETIANEYPEACCSIFESYVANELSVDQSAVWALGSNPFNSSNIRINTEMRLSNNAELTIDGVDLLFGPEGRLVIEPGAKLISNNNRLGPIDCSEATWKGIQVQGNSSFGANPQVQGFIELDGVIIEHADQAIRPHDPNAPSSTGGGIIHARNTVFNNNRRAVEFLKNNFEQTSFFEDCSFTVDDDFRFGIVPGPGTGFQAHVTMWKTRGVKFYSCDFSNTMTVPTIVYRKSAIGTLSSEFKVFAKCAINPVPDPCLSYDVSTFVGFNTAINIGVGKSGSSDASCLVDNAHFSGNAIGIRCHGVDNVDVFRSTFQLPTKKMANFEDVTREGIQLIECTGYDIEDNSFDVNEDYDPTNNAYGITIVNSGGADNQIYRNDFNRMGKANRAYGQNKQNPNEPDGYGGLRYLCNTNNDNGVDFYVGVVNNTDGIAQHQGIVPMGPVFDEITGAGNTFSSMTASHFYNGSAFIPVIYYHHSSEPAPSISPVNVFPAAADYANGCASRFPDQMEGLIGGVYEDTHIAYDELKAVIEQSLTTLTGKIDDNRKASLLQDINTANSDLDPVFDDLLEISPYLSWEILEALSLKSNPIGKQLLLNIILQNTAALKQQDLREKIKINLSLDPTEESQLLQASLAHGPREQEEGLINAQKARGLQLKNALIAYALTNGLSEDLEALVSAGSEQHHQMAAINLLIANQDYSSAINLLNNLQSNDTNMQEIIDGYKDYKNFEITLLQAGKNWDELAESEITQLVTIAEEEIGLAQVQARGILNFFYGYDYTFFETAEDPATPRSQAQHPSAYDALLSKNINIAPNPSNDYVIVSINQERSLSTDGIWTIYGVDGNRALSGKIEGGKQFISLKSLSPGIYIFNIVLSNGALHNERLIIQ